jgi:hypothetical protein
MDGLCLTCGLWDDLEAHHIAGRGNATIVVPVCVPCHTILSNWQRAAGIELEHDAPRTETDRTRALVVGSVHLLQLFAQRHRDRSWISTELWAYTARASSRILDACAPPDRPGRWLPDPTVLPAEGTPAAWTEAAEVQCTFEFAHLLLILTRQLGDTPPLTCDVLANIAADPQSVIDAFTRVAADEDSTRQLLQLVQDYLSTSSRMVRQLLTLDLNDPDAIEQAVLEEASSWFSTGQRLLQQLLAVALGTAPEVAS